MVEAEAKRSRMLSSVTGSRDGVEPMSDMISCNKQSMVITIW